MVLRYLLVFLLLICSCLIFIQSQEVDIAWDFNNVGDYYRSGWANGSIATIGMESKVEYGELRLSIKGNNPKLDSPSLFLNVTNRHYVVMRMRYNGLANQARLLLRSGPKVSTAEQLLAKTSYWNHPIQMVAIADTGNAATANNRSLLVDGNVYTYYSAGSTSNVQITFDLGSFRWITTLSILPTNDANSPKRCILLRSMSSGVGPFEAVYTFTLLNSSQANNNIPQQFSGFQGFARYWKLLVLDNYGGSSINIREIQLQGYDETVSIVPFTLDNSYQYTMYYLPIHQAVIGNLLRMRFELIYNLSLGNNPTGDGNNAQVIASTGVGINNIHSYNTILHQRGTYFHESWDIDYIHILRAPVIYKVRGCLDQYSNTPNYQQIYYNITNHIAMINNHLPIYSYTQHNLTLPYARTYDCPAEGNVTISLEGINFGYAPQVYVGSQPCKVISLQAHSIDGRLQQLLCILPQVSTGNGGWKRVRIVNSMHPQLFYEVEGLAYRIAPSVPARPQITNIAATKVDLVWTVPGDEFMHLTVTGYKILWFSPTTPQQISNVTVGNITTTSIRGLNPGTEYIFAIAAIAEGRENALLPTDLYGRRTHLVTGLLGTFSTYTNVTGTLPFDFSFDYFNSNKTLNHSTNAQLVNTNGPTGQYGAEGHYGLVLVGSANIQNCNVSSTCCDGYDANVGVSSCGNYESVCAVIAANMLPYTFVNDGITRRGVSSNLPYSNGAPPDISISTLATLVANKGANPPSIACGPALRLTPSIARNVGAAWYPRKMNVREGFDTYFTFEISNPSQKCDRLDDVNTFCRSRGADGLAFVLQNVAPDALGLAGSGLGYEGIFNALAVELDTYHNYDQMDYYENHISVMTQVISNKQYVVYILC